MEEPLLRLGDMIDDYCPRCKHLLNHDIASLLDGKVFKVICRTCYSEHAYLRGKVPRKKSASGPTTLFDQVLAKAAPTAEAPTPAVPKKKRATPARYISRRKSGPSAGRK